MMVRAMTAADIAAVAAIEDCSPSPWRAAALLDELGRQNGLSLVAENDDGLCGWCCAFWTAGEAELLKIAVAVERRRQAVATMLLQTLVQSLTTRQIGAIFLEVREGNEGARRFYARHGFCQVGRRPGYYRDPADHAVILRKVLIGQ